MLALILILGVAQVPACGATEGVFRDALTQATRFNLTGALARLEAEPLRSCDAARVALIYLRALQAARDAYPAGGAAAALAPVEMATDALAREYARTGDRRAELARVVLMAAAAAAQSERGDMELLLAHAASLEETLIRAGQTGAPGIAAHEAAGDLWLQVHRYEAARRAYQAAADLLGLTPRSALGLARVALRLNDEAAACRAYESLLALVTWKNDEAPVELTEARMFLASSQRCAAASARPRE